MLGIWVENAIRKIAACNNNHGERRNASLRAIPFEKGSPFFNGSPKSLSWLSPWRSSSSLASVYFYCLFFSKRCLFFSKRCSSLMLLAETHDQLARIFEISNTWFESSRNSNLNLLTKEDIVFETIVIARTLTDVFSIPMDNDRHDRGRRHDHLHMGHGHGTRWGSNGWGNLEFDYFIGYCSGLSKRFVHFRSSKRSEDIIKYHRMPIPTF